MGMWCAYGVHHSTDAYRHPVVACSAYVGLEVEEGARLYQERRDAAGVEGGGHVKRCLAVLC